MLFLGYPHLLVGRHSFFNTRRLSNIIFSPPSITPEIIVTLDAEKAFDRVEWGYLFFILGKFGFDSQFISWIKLLYASPTASVHINGIRSPPFFLQRGTRQGCPLSPLFQMQSIANSIQSPVIPLLPYKPVRAALPPVTQNQFDKYANLNTDDVVGIIKELLSQYSIR